MDITAVSEILEFAINAGYGWLLQKSHLQRRRVRSFGYQPAGGYRSTDAGHVYIYAVTGMCGVLDSRVVDQHMSRIIGSE